MNNSQPSKLFKLRKWLILPDAARHLSVVCGEDVSEADILRLALDGHLQLSLNLVKSTHAKPAKWVYFAEWKNLVEASLSLKNEFQDQSDYDEFLLKLSNSYGEKKAEVINDDKVHRIDGVWDLPLIGYERIFIGRKYQKLTDLPFEENSNSEEINVERGGNLYEIQLSLIDCKGYAESAKQERKKIRRLEESKSNNKRKENLLILRKEKYEKLKVSYFKWIEYEKYFPATEFPDDSILVIRTDALREFEKLISDLEPEGNVTLNNDFKPKRLTKQSNGYEERHAKNREQILGAGLAVLAKWPEECRTEKGEPLASKIAKMVESKAELFWPDAKPH